MALLWEEIKRGLALLLFVAFFFVFCPFLFFVFCFSLSLQYYTKTMNAGSIKKTSNKRKHLIQHEMTATAMTDKTKRQLRSMKSLTETWNQKVVELG